MLEACCYGDLDCDCDVDLAGPANFLGFYGTGTRDEAYKAGFDDSGRTNLAGLAEPLNDCGEGIWGRRQESSAAVRAVVRSLDVS